MTIEISTHWRAATKFLVQIPFLSQALTEPSRQTPVWGCYDVVVLGGGPAGIAAATAAANTGQSTLLIEAYGFLDGMGTAAGVTNFCGLHANVYGDVRQVVHGIAAFKVAADALVLASGARLLFHTKAVGALMNSASEIGAILIETKSGRHAVVAKTFIDCSGDADLAAHAGVPFEKGKGPNGAGHDMMYPLTMFRVNGVDPVRAGDAYNHFGALMDEAEKRGRKSPII